MRLDKLFFDNLSRAAAVAAILTLTATVATAQSWSGRGRANGRVTDKETGAPLEGVKITLQKGGLEGDGPPPIFTDSEGRWSYLGLGNGNWIVLLDKDGYMPSKGSIQVSRSSKPVNVSIRPIPGSLTEEADVTSKVDHDWRVGCTTDKFSDEKQCFVVRWFAPCAGCQKSEVVRAEINKHGIWLVFGNHTHPGRTGRVRIDSNDHESFEETIIIGAQAERIVAQMLSGHKGIAETVTWPSETTSFEFDLVGFKEAYEEMRTLYSGESPVDEPPDGGRP